MAGSMYGNDDDDDGDDDDNNNLLLFVHILVLRMITTQHLSC
jgi:hypothetical protein